MEDSMATACSKFTFTVLFNGRLASSDKLSGNEGSCTVILSRGGLIGKSTDELRVAIEIKQDPPPGKGLGGKEFGGVNVVRHR